MRFFFRRGNKIHTSGEDAGWSDDLAAVLLFGSGGRCRSVFGCWVFFVSSRRTCCGSVCAATGAAINALLLVGWPVDRDGVDERRQRVQRNASRLLDGGGISNGTGDRCQRRNRPTRKTMSHHHCLHPRRTRLA
jgi:hypothetical protein